MKHRLIAFLLLAGAFGAEQAFAAGTCAVSNRSERNGMTGFGPRFPLKYRPEMSTRPGWGSTVARYDRCFPLAGR